MKDEKGSVFEPSRRKILIGTGALAAGVALTQLDGLVKKAEATGGKTEKWPD